MMGRHQLLKGATMPAVRETHWRRWVATFAGIVLLLKSLAFALSKLVHVVTSEAQATGRDTDLVLGLAGRRRGVR
jgi:hypothetical protein